MTNLVIFLYICNKKLWNSLKTADAFYFLLSMGKRFRPILFCICKICSIQFICIKLHQSVRWLVIKNFQNVYDRKIHCNLYMIVYKNIDYKNIVLSLNLLKMFKEIENNLNKTQTFVNFYEIKKSKCLNDFFFEILNL